jgi:hypothetical protein
MATINMIMVSSYAAQERVLDDADYAPELEIEHFPYLLDSQITPANTICVVTTAADTNKVVTATHQYELCHQRLGHAPASCLYHTSKQVAGLPTISPTALPTFLRCRACDIAKLKKASRGPPLDDPITLQTGQQFSMDLGFMRGPANLQAVVERTEDGPLHNKKSSQADKAIRVTS